MSTHNILTTRREHAGAIVPIGYILAIIIPLVGLIVGIVVATRPAHVTSRHGAWIILISVLAFFAYIILIVASVSTTTTPAGY